MTAITHMIDQHTRVTVINELCERLLNEYVFPEAAKQTVELIKGKLADGQYDSFADAESFAAQLTEDIQVLTKDLHLRVRFNEEARSTEPVRAEADARAEYEKRVARENGGFYKVERLPGNIGYIDLRMFADPAVCGDTAAAAMTLVANTEALIFDLRKNGGGMPRMVMFLCSYLFEGEDVHLNSFYFRPDDSTKQYWTQSHVPGKRYGQDKPVYVLTSNYTFSGGEEFAYDLQNLKRATIIGEVTGGGAHPGGVLQLTEHFNMFLPVGRAINPITGTNWEGVGVQPDLKVSAEEAFDIAYTKALETVLGRVGEDAEKRDLVKAVRDVLVERTSEVVTA